MLGATLQNSQLSLNDRPLHVQRRDQQFEGQFPGPSTQNWNMVQATVTANINSNLVFSKVFNLRAQLAGESTAAHRPRDVA